MSARILPDMRGFLEAECVDCCSDQIANAVNEARGVRAAEGCPCHFWSGVLMSFDDGEPLDSVQDDESSCHLDRWNET